MTTVKFIQKTIVPTASVTGYINTTPESGPDITSRPTFLIILKCTHMSDTKWSRQGLALSVCLSLCNNNSLKRGYVFKRKWGDMERVGVDRGRSGNDVHSILTKL